MILKLGTKHQPKELYKVNINHDPWMTFFTARSTYFAHAFELGKLLKYDLKGKACRKWANRQNNYVYELTLLDCLHLPRGYIHVHDHNKQIHNSLLMSVLDCVLKLKVK